MAIEWSNETTGQTYGELRRVSNLDGRVEWEANCPVHAMRWRDGVLAKLGFAQPMLNLFEVA